jgi:hypothetical protein
MTKILVSAEPTKQFFVRMLTRDIELLDAILDLLDNCIDGIIRSKKKPKKDADPSRPYDGYYAKIIANKSQFVIEDNCGGIPKDIAEKVAFRLGRPTEEELEKIGVKIERKGTVGVYGIGMKRAIFKMGKHAVVRTEQVKKAYQVEITPEWLKSGSWALAMEVTAATGVEGTRIEVNDLNDEIAQQFSQETNFLGDLRKVISELFAVIIGKGFLVEINGTPVTPVELALLLAPSGNGSGSINPYAFRGHLSGVEVEIVVGFHREPYKIQEAEDDDDPRGTHKKAGWSVICNDRLVLYADKTYMTGWGSKPIPRFHNQYNAIAGIVTLRSDDPELLPLNTTKRKIEVSFGVYFKILEYMKDGLRRFIDFTNDWKGRLQETAPKFEGAKPVLAAEAAEKVLGEKQTKVSPQRLADPNAEAVEHTPKLPAPPKETSTKQIRFTKPSSEISEIGRALLSDSAAEPKAVGEACFDRVLRDLRRKPKKS